MTESCLFFNSLAICMARIDLPTHGSPKRHAISPRAQSLCQRSVESLSGFLLFVGELDGRMLLKVLLNWLLLALSALRKFFGRLLMVVDVFY